MTADGLSELNELLALAERAFAFLLQRGFDLRSRTPPKTGFSRDGWILEYHSGRVDVRVEYLDYQFNVVFDQGGTRASYLMIDRELHARRSGFYGDMFGPEKLAGAIEHIASDIGANYSDVIAGAELVWAKLKRLGASPVEKGKLP